ncbi:MAG: hypothetical protein H6598_01030 [Flavobacteriales bacterium]|nr:hypothetical protein [Flavobacteriales bacterium]
MKKIITAFTFILVVVTTNAQSTPEERFDDLKANYAIVMEKLQAGTLSLEDENYMACRKMFKKINSYDKYTTMQTDEFKTIQTKFDEIKPLLELGTVYTSSNAGGTSESSFTTGKKMFLVLKTGKTTVAESLKDHPNESGHKVLTVYFESENHGTAIIHLDVPEDKWSSNEYLVEIPLDGSEKIFKELYLLLGKLGQGDHSLNVILPRGEFAYSINKNVPRVEIPVKIKVVGDDFKKMADQEAKDNLSNTVLEKGIAFDPDQEFMLYSIFLNDYPDYDIIKLNVLEDWYELKSDGKLTYMKLNTVIAFKDGSGNCIKVYIDFVQKNMADVGVKLGPMEILQTGAKQKFIPIPCENIK